MIKSELIERLAERQRHLTEKDIAISINKIIERIADHLNKKGRIEIRNFGSFVIHYRKPRLAHNPKTGEKLTTKSKHVVHFKPGKDLKKRINDGAKNYAITTPVKEERAD